MSLLLVLFLTGCHPDVAASLLDSNEAPVPTPDTGAEEASVDMRFGSVRLSPGASVDLEELAERGGSATTLTSAEGARFELTWRFGEVDEAYALFKEGGGEVEPSTGDGFGVRLQDDGGGRCVYICGQDGILLFQSRPALGEPCPAFVDTTLVLVFRSTSSPPPWPETGDS